MHVPQFPASHENGGDSPARRALSKSVSLSLRGTSAFLRSRWMVMVPPVSSASAGAAAALGGVWLRRSVEVLDEYLPGSGVVPT